MKAFVSLGHADLATMAEHAGHAPVWDFVADEDGLRVKWGDPHVHLFFAWDHFESGKPEENVQPRAKAAIMRSVGARGEVNETLPGLDGDIRKWTKEATEDDDRRGS